MTNKEMAQAYRGAAKALEHDGYIAMSFYLEKEAYRLDPPKPEPGTYVWCQIAGCEWELAEVTSTGLMIFGSDNMVRWEEVERYKPARILEPGQVAINRTLLKNIVEILQTEGYCAMKDVLQFELDRDKKAGHE